MNHFGDGNTELLIFQKETDQALMCARTWWTLGVAPFEDKEFDAEVACNKGDNARVSLV